MKCHKLITWMRLQWILTCLPHAQWTLQETTHSIYKNDWKWEELFHCHVSLPGGWDKMTPMVIFEWKTMSIDNFSPQLVVHVHAKGWWMDLTGMKIWINKFGSTPGRASHEESFTSIRHVQDPSNRFNKDSVERAQHWCAIIPGGWGANQPATLDVALNKTFKDTVRILWSKWMTGDTDQEFTRAGNLRKPSIRPWCQWVLWACKQIDTPLW